MTEIAWYPFYVGDYARKTAHLSLLEHGAYRLLMDHYYATRHPLPNDPTKLFRICRARSPSERKAVLSVIAEFFTEDGTLMRSEKCDSEIDKQLKYSDAQSAKAKLRHSSSSATAVPRARVPQPQSEEKEKKTVGTRFALQDPPADWLQFCQTQRPELNPGAVFDGFRDYWIAKAGREGVKLDWFATWRNWVRNQKSTNGGSNGRPKTKLDLAAEGIARAAAKREQREQSQAGQADDGLFRGPETLWP